MTFQSLLRLLLGVLAVTSFAQTAHAACRNGVLEPGEACDDGNSDDTDGCSNSCTVNFGYACGCQTPTITFPGSAYAGRLGGAGGRESSDLACNSDEIIMGLQFNVPNDGNPQSVTRTRVLCGRLTLNSQGRPTTTRTQRLLEGGDGCSGWDPSVWRSEVNCPDGWVVNGVEGTLSGSTTFNNVRVRCAEIDVDGTPTGLETVLVASGTYGSGTPNQTPKCSAGRLASAFRTRSGCAQDALDLYCGTPNVDCSSRRSVCVSTCGDGQRASDEACEDGNTTSGDGCSSACLLENGATGCGQDADCADGNAACVGGRCVIQVGEGPCTSSIQCEGAISCASGVCGGDGGACSDNNQCVGSCLGGTCGPPSTTGGACDPNDDEDCQGAVTCNASGTCGGDGSMCTSNAECVEACIGGVCGSPSAPGGSCDPNDDSDCAGAVACDGSGVCGGTGTVCASNAECAETCVGGLCGPPASPGGTCDPNDDADCQGAVTCSAGGVCGGTGTSCSSNQECVETCVAGVCGPPSTTGGSCDPNDDTDCAGALSCSASGVCGGGGSGCSANGECVDACIAGNCGTPSGPGGTCDPGDDTDCAGGLACSPGGTCGGTGAGCSSNAECVEACISGTCGSPSGPGGACDPNEDADCAGGVACNASGLCGGTGAACSSGAQCVENCVAGVCTGPVPKGGTCGVDADCEPGLLCNAAKTCDFDTDGDGVPNDDDDDDDNDGVCDGSAAGSGCVAGPDADPLDENVCRDQDGDSCDDCAVTGANSSGGDTTNDGLDTDSDGACDAGDPDDDGDGVADADDADGLDPNVCRDSDGDTCDDCSRTGADGSGGDVANDGTDTDGDGTCNGGDDDDDGDGVTDDSDVAPRDPMRCRDIDADGCDDCAFEGANGSGGNPDGDGDDSDGDGICDIGDDDDDGDGVEDTSDLDPKDPNRCRDRDADGCDDCVLTGADGSGGDPANDGVDIDGDGFCDDTDADNDGVNNAIDTDPSDPSKCSDLDRDGCDDCSVTGADGSGGDIANDGADLDGDGTCDASDADQDGDGICDGEEAPGFCQRSNDRDPTDPSRCADTDADGCDDCTSGTFDPDADGPDEDGDGLCNGSDDFDGDGVIDNVDVDDDGDGIRDVDENLLNLDPDGDADGDGIRNWRDADDRGDGVKNVCDDNDGDGICDATPTAYDEDGDGAPNHLDTDADGDGLSDASEAGYIPDDSDVDGDGVLDTPVGDNGLSDELETSPDSGMTTSELADSDDDGVPNALDPDSDLDGDGVPDREEVGDRDLSTPPRDTDGDGIPDVADEDDDGDGLPTEQEGGSRDTDGDGTPDYRDSDDDGDGLPTAEERPSNGAEVDTDEDGEEDYLDADDDGDGIPTIEERTEDGEDVNSDDDIAPDYLDPDDDNDGIPSAEEITRAGRDRDSDGDGIPDRLDPDDDGDGIPPTDELGDFDGDGTPDRLQVGPQGNLAGGPQCSAGSVGAGSKRLPLWLLPLVVVALLSQRRRIRWWLAAGLSLVLLAVPTPGVQAQVNLNRFHAAPLATDGFGLGRPEMLKHLGLGANLTVDYANDPLLYELNQDRDRIVNVVSHQTTLQPSLALGLFDRATVFVTIPMHVDMRGQTLAGRFPPADGPGLGDISLGGRLLLAGGVGKVGALSAELIARLPTATWAQSDQAYSGDELGSYEPALTGEYRAGPFDVRLRLGARFRRGIDVGALSLGQEMLVGLGMRYRISRPLALHAEWQLSTFLDDAFGRESTPSELIGGAKYQLGDVVFGVAAGPGISSGFGAPDLRVIGMVGYANVIGDQDGDGILDPQDECLTAPEDKDGFEDEDGCPDPDNDGDGVPDEGDQCPDEAEDIDGFEDGDGCPDLDNDGDGVEDEQDGCPLQPEDLDDFEDDDGCPDPDNDGDGIPDQRDKCPMDAEDIDGFEDADGCPDEDNDGDGIADHLDKCPDQAEDVDFYEDDDGCPEPGAPKVRVTCDQIEINESIYFASGKAQIKKRSFGLLQEVASVMRQAKHIRLLKVEGHTDSQGGDGYNKRLSRARARAVMQFLTEDGVSQDRLTFEGFGEEQPVATNRTAAGRAKNRRVVFRIIKQETVCEK